MNQEPLIAHRPRFTPMHGVLLALVAVAIVLVRWVLLATFGSDTPYWDQWDGEVSLLYKPFADGTLPLAQFFAPHNEHRIAFSRAFNLLLFVVNDYQFDNLVETFANAIVYTGGLLLAAWPLLTRVSGANLLLGACIVLMAGIAPYGAENLLIGFQNAFYFMNAFAVGAVMALSLGSGTIAIVAAIALAAASLFTLASGLLAAPALAFVALLRWRNGGLSNAATSMIVGIALVIALAGWALLPAAPHHQALHPRDFTDFLHAAAGILAWPLPGHPLTMLVVWWPSAVALWRLARRSDPQNHRIDLYLLGISAWVFLQALAIAHSRGHEMTLVNSRYTDTLALAPLVNLVLALRLLRVPRGPANRRATAAVVGVSAAAIACGFVAVTVTWAPFLMVSAQNYTQSRANLRAYLDGQGIHAFEGKPAAEISYPQAARLATLLEDPTVRDMLPPSVRPPAPSLVLQCTAFESFGAYPTTPALTYTVGSFRAGIGDASVGTCASTLFRSRFDYFVFRIAGYPNRPGMSLVLYATDGSATPVRVPIEPRETWTSVTVRNPGGSVHWVATDENPDSWFAFTRPIGVGRLSALRTPLDTWLDFAPSGMQQ